MNIFIHGKIILVISSDTQFIHLPDNSLLTKEVQIVHYHSGLDALDALSTILPHLILSDFKTDDMDGAEIFKAIMTDRSFQPYRHIPFILFSDEGVRNRYYEELFHLGLRGWFVTPIGTHEMNELIINLLIIQTKILKNRELRQEVKRSEYRYRDLLENANDLIFTLDGEGKFAYLNNRFSPLTGWDKESWFEKPFLDLVDKTDRDVALKHYEMAHQGRARVFEARIIGKTRDTTILSFNITPIVERGSIVGSMGIARDVTEQKKMEREIRDLKNFNESIIESMEAGLLTTDLSGHITSLNAGAEKILGWKVEEVIGKSVNTVLNSEEADYLLSNPPKPGSLPYSREMELTVKTGKKISIGFTTTDRIDNRRKKVGTIVSFRDITELKQMQSEVMRMDRLASLGVLASGIAHEIKNPLAGIKTMAQACEEEFDDSDPRMEYLTRIVRQVNRLDDLLKTFFAYSRPKPPDRKLHKLPEIVQEVTKLVSKEMKNYGIRYREHFSQNLKEVMVDSQQIQQVFLNLILNSIEAMKIGGTLNVKTRNIKKPLTGLIQQNKGKVLIKNGEFVEVVISDTGEGIDPDNLETIFDPFFTTKPNGMGLGLSIVYRIVEEHGGEIRVESEVGHGTSFTITLPTGA